MRSEIDDVAPLDQHDRPVVEQFGEGEIIHLGGVLEAVEIHVMQHQVSGLIGVHQGVGRRGDRLVDAQLLGEALRERRLSGTHLPGEHDEITGARKAGDGGRETTRVFG